MKTLFIFINSSAAYIINICTYLNSCTSLYITITVYNKSHSLHFMQIHIYQIKPKEQCKCGCNGQSNH